MAMARTIATAPPHTAQRPRRSLFSAEFIVYYAIAANYLWSMATVSLPTLARICASDIVCAMSLRARHIDESVKGGVAWAATWRVRDALFGMRSSGSGSLPGSVGGGDAAPRLLFDGGVAMAEMQPRLIASAKSALWQGSRAEFEQRKGYALLDAINWRANGVVDLTDLQWRGFRDALPLLVCAAALQLCVTRLLRRSAWVRALPHSRWAPRLIFGLGFAIACHGASAFILLLLVVTGMRT